MSGESMSNYMSRLQAVARARYRSSPGWAGFESALDWLANPDYRGRPMSLTRDEYQFLENLREKILTAQRQWAMEIPTKTKTGKGAAEPWFPK